MKIVDAHHHLWDLRRFPYPWLRPEAGPRPFGDHASITRDYLAQSYAADAGDALAGSVHVQANSGAAIAAEETRWVAEETRKLSWPVAIVGAIDLEDVKLEDTLARHAEYPPFRGVRIFAGYDADPAWRQCAEPGLLVSPAVQRLAELLCRRGLSLDVVVHAAQLPDVATLGAAFPDLPIIINHLGHPRKPDFASAALWRDGIVAAAGVPNACIKISGLWTVDRDWRPEILSPFVQHAVAAFGSRRSMYGSNLPIEKVMVRPDLLVPRVLRALGSLSETDRDAILRGTAARVYRL